MAVAATKQLTAFANWRFDSCVTRARLMHKDQIREILTAHGRLSVNVEALTDDSDLYDAGLTSLMTVNLLLALEDSFDVEFPDRMLSRRTFQSINALSAAISEIISLREQ